MWEVGIPFHDTFVFEIIPNMHLILPPKREREEGTEMDVRVNS